MNRKNLDSLLSHKPRLILLLVLIITVLTAYQTLSTLSTNLKFITAAGDGDITTVTYMLDKGMEPDTISLIGGSRAISRASLAGKFEVVCLLLERGANPTYGLPQAILGNHVEIVHLLIAHGANVKHWSNYEITPLQFAKERGNMTIINSIRAAGAK